MAKGTPHHKLIAQLIRDKLKQLNVAGTVTSGEGTVDIYVIDLPYNIMLEIENYARQFRKGIATPTTPQVKYILIENEMSDKKAQEIYDKIRQDAENGQYLPQGYNEAKDMWIGEHFISKLVYRNFCRC